MATDSSQRSALKDFLGSIATIKGDLSNITAPPFVLSTQSTTELPAYWAEHPDLFAAPAAGPTPQARALLVLKWFILSLRRQQYGGRPESEGVKKPLNAFLGELFIATFPSPSRSDETTLLIAEQVSHHPPITACYLHNPSAGVVAEGFACQRITFNGSVNIKQMGHAVLTLEKITTDGLNRGAGEQYLIPLPAVKVPGILTGNPYPELQGHCSIPSSSGFVSELDFSGKRVLGLGGTRHHVHATVAGPDGKTVFEVEGEWNGKMVVTDGAGAAVETWDVGAMMQHTLPKLAEPREQSPWESRRAWGGLVEALNAGDMQGVVDEKNKIEEAQREMRKREGGKPWQTAFFRKHDADERFEALVGKGSQAAAQLAQGSREHGFWRFDQEALSKERPFREGKPWEV